MGNSLAIIKFSKNFANILFINFYFIVIIIYTESDK